MGRMTAVWVVDPKGDILAIEVRMLAIASFLMPFHGGGGKQVGGNNA